MYSILVVDDFALDRRQIIGLIESYANLPVFICGECENGYEALEAVRNLHPDILIVDVEMPGMNGIELANQLRAQNDALRIVFCSLYDKAHFLRSAIQVRSDGYLMKPIDSDELRRTLEDILLRMTNLERQRQQFEALRLAMAENRISLRREFFSDALLGGEMSEINLEHRMRQLGFGGDTVFRMAVVDLNTNTPLSAQLDKDDDGLIPYRVFHSLVVHSHDQSPYYVVHISDRRYTMVFSFEGNPPPEQTHAIAERVLESFVAHMRESAISLSATFGNQVASVRELRSQYRLCCYRLNHRWKYSGDDVIFAGDSLEIVDDPMPDIQMIQTELRMLLEMENEDIARSAAEYADALLSDLPLSRQQLICHYVLGNIRLALQEDGISSTGKNGEPGVDILSLTDTQGCRAFVRDLIVDAYGAIHRSAPSGGNELVEQIRRFIRESDLKTVQLRSVAKHFSYSPNYLNHVFKTATGATILDFITLCRIARAKELMQATTMNLAEIAEEIGYSHATYLSIVFKKQEGVTPKQYMGRYRS